MAGNVLSLIWKGGPVAVRCASARRASSRRCGVLRGIGIALGIGGLVVVCSLFWRRRRRRGSVLQLQELRPEAATIFGSVKEGAVGQPMAQGYHFPFAADAPRRTKAADANDSAVFLLELRDAFRAGGTVDEVYAVDEEALGNAMRKVIRPSRQGSFDGVPPAAIHNVIEDSCMPSTLLEVSVRTFSHDSANLCQAVWVAEHGLWRKLNALLPLEEVI